MKPEKIKELREKTMATFDKVYETKVYQYYIDADGHLKRAKRKDLDTTAMLEPGAIEILD